MSASFSILVFLFPVVLCSRDVSGISFKAAFDKRLQLENADFGLQFYCGDLMPTLLQKEDDEPGSENDTSFVDYYHYYKHRKVRKESNDD